MGMSDIAHWPGSREGGPTRCTADATTLRTVWTHMPLLSTRKEDDGKWPWHGWNTGWRNDAERETVERLSASDVSDQASLGSNSASEQSRSWSQLIRSGRLRKRHQRRASQPTALCGGGPLRRSQAASTLVEGENGVFLVGSHDGDKTRGEEKRTRESGEKQQKETRHSRNFSKLWRVVGSNKVARHCKKLLNPSVVLFIDHSRHTAWVCKDF